MPLSGAYNGVLGDATAFPHSTARFLLKDAVVFDPDASTEEKGAARRWLTRSWESAHPWGTGGVYVNFPEPDLREPETAYYGANCERLHSIKLRYDADDFFGFR